MGIVLVPDEILFGDISAQAVRLYAAQMEWPEASIAELARALSCSPSTVKRARRELAEVRGFEPRPRLTPAHALLHLLGDRDGWTCTYCMTPVQCRCRGGETAQADHCFPASRGGTDDIENRTLCCFECNRVKGARTPKEWFVGWAS